MKLCQLRIHNYRSIRDLALEVPDMLVLIGPNNHGKSNVLSAIEFGLSTSAKPDLEDFCACREDGDDQLWVEMIFRDLTDQEKKTFEKYLLVDGTIRIRKSARIQEDGSIAIAYNGYVQEPDQWWLKSSAWDRLSSREKIEQKTQTVPELRLLLEQGGRITRLQLEAFQREYIRQHRQELTFAEILEEAPLLGQKNVSGSVLPDFFLVPAVRDLGEETKFKTTTTFGRLLQRAVREMAERDEQFVEVRDRFKALIDGLNSRPEQSGKNISAIGRLEATLTEGLADWGVTASIQVTPPELEKIFELGTQLYVDDGLKTLAERKGHGLQRAILFALVRAWAQSLRPGGESTEIAPRRSSDSVFFAIEEPELFLHPQAQRQLLAALETIADATNHQVFLSTHSTHFVDLDHYKRLTIVTKSDPAEGTRVRQCTRELFEGEDADKRKHRFHMASWINPDRAELFFASKVVLVEGETERAVLPFLAHRMQCFDPHVSVIDCGSKHNISLYMEILNAFRIQYCVIHDEDPVPDPIPEDWTVEKLKTKRNTFEMNQKIQNLLDEDLGEVEILSPDFETAAGISRNQADKKGKALAALEFFEEIEAETIPERIAEVVRKAYRLRSGGVGSNE